MRWTGLKTRTSQGILTSGPVVEDNCGNALVDDMYDVIVWASVIGIYEGYLSLTFIKHIVASDTTVYGIDPSCSMILQSPCPVAVMPLQS